MKIGDIIECLQTQDQGTIVSSRATFGGREDVIKMSFGIDWYNGDDEKPRWTNPDSLKVINSNATKK